MEPMMFVELVDREGRVISRHEVANDAFPLTVRLEGEHVVTTNAARNVGRIEGAHHDMREVTPSFLTSHGLWRFLHSPIGTLFVSIITIGIFAISLYTKTYGDKNGADVFGFALATFFGLLTWAGLWALGGRIAHNPAHFREQLVWTCIAAVASMIGRSIVMWGDFLFPASDIVSMITIALLLMLSAAILYGHITIASRLPQRTRWAVVAGTAAIIGAIVGLATYATNDKFNTDLDYTAALRPLDAQYIPGESAESFTTSIGELRKDVDDAAKKQ